MSLAAALHIALGKQCRANPMADPGSSSFGELFELHWALEEAVSNAAKKGVDICPADVIGTILLDQPRARVSAAEMHEALIHAAARAGVKVRSN